MLVNRIIKIVLLLLGGVFVVLEGFAFEIEAAAVSACILILLTTLYCSWTNKKSKYFIWFLVLFTVAYVINYVSWFSSPLEQNDIDYYYYVSNILFIVSYILLIARITANIKLKTVLKELFIPLVILIVLDVFCVVLLTDTAKSALTLEEYIIEFTYNAVIMALLSAALINYMYRYDNKSMLFLVGAICMIFSEIIQLAYYYVLEDRSLGFIYSFFFIIALMFFYIQSQMQFTGPLPDYLDEQLES